MTEAYPETPEVQDSWGCNYVCDNPVWKKYGEVALDFQYTIDVFSHQCRGANAPLYTVDGEFQGTRENLAEYVRGLYGNSRV